MRRVVVTGLGAVTSLGHDVESTWRNIVDGKSGVSLIDSFDTSGFASRIGATVRNLDMSPYMSPKEVRKTDPFIHYGIAASVQAINDAGLEVTDQNAERIGIAIGSGIGGLPG
ncbi:MAG TPA: beta-ketoacyl synthase N-terminal-like domain-containing protein, partial [Gammaproteobacteria bacterium]|nr:beta-ketoacyl synthase N-terminal-like domain-containing protein [Gammaproteobacteria bacterium]